MPKNDAEMWKAIEKSNEEDRRHAEQVERDEERRQREAEERNREIARQQTPHDRYGW